MNVHILNTFKTSQSSINFLRNLTIVTLKNHFDHEFNIFLLQGRTSNQYHKINVVSAGDPSLLLLFIKISIIKGIKQVTTNA